MPRIRTLWRRAPTPRWKGGFCSPKLDLSRRRISWSRMPLQGYQDNANGTADGVAPYIVDGEINPPESFSGTYSVNADCTGTSTFTDGTQFNLVTTPDGRMHTYVQTKPSGVVASRIALRVGD